MCTQALIRLGHRMRGKTWWAWTGALVAAVVLATGASPVAAGPATEAVKTTIDEVIRILTDKELKKPERADERRRQLEKVIGARFDYDEMAKRSLGAHWSKRSEKERKEFVEAFKTFLSNSYADRILGYSGEQVQYLNERLEEDSAEVRTKMVSTKTEIPLNYRLLNKGGEWRVYDVVVDGISLVSNYRGQFNRIIRSSSFEDLVEKLRKKPEEIKKTEGAKKPDEKTSP